MNASPDRLIALQPERRCTVVIMLWSGFLGGTETLMAAIARELATSCRVQVFFIADPGLMGKRLQDAGVSYDALHVSPRELLLRPWLLRPLAAALNPDCIILPTVTYFGMLLRLAGYRGTLVSVDHGAIANLMELRGLSRAARHVSRICGVLATTYQVAVSDFCLSEIGSIPHARKTIRIYNGVDLDRYFCIRKPSPNGIRYGVASRHIQGKGLDTAIFAFARVREACPDAQLSIAGDGPERATLEHLATQTGHAQAVTFSGAVNEMLHWWNNIDVAIVPSSSFIETFGMAAAEAMACGRPVIATRNGALPEVVEDRVTGILVQPGDVESLTKAMLEYATNGDLLERHGAAGRTRATEHFNIRRTASDYHDLCSCPPDRRTKLSRPGREEATTTPA